MNAKEIVGTLRTLASDPNNRAHIVRDQGCLPGLVIFLTDKDSEVVFTALEVVYFLSLHAGNRPQMASEPGLLKNVKKLMVTGSLKEKKVAIQAYTNLQAHAAKEPKPEQNAEATTHTDVPAAENQAEAKSHAKPTTALAGHKHPMQAKTGLSMYGDSVRTRAANTFTLYIGGMNTESARSQIESILLKSKGVISFFFDLCEQKVVIRATMTADDVIERISSGGWKASTNKKDIGASTGEINKENEPEYLDESAGGNNGSWFGFGAITLFGQETPDKARLEKQNQQGNGWLSKLKLW